MADMATLLTRMTRAFNLIEAVFIDMGMSLPQESAGLLWIPKERIGEVQVEKLLENGPLGLYWSMALRGVIDKTLGEQQRSYAAEVTATLFRPQPRGRTPHYLLTLQYSAERDGWHSSTKNRRGSRAERFMRDVTIEPNIAVQGVHEELVRIAGIFRNAHVVQA